MFALFDLDAFLTLCGAFCRFSLASVLLFWYFFLYFHILYVYFLIFDFLVFVFILCMLCECLCVCKEAADAAHFSFLRCVLLLFSLFEENAIFLTFGRISQRAAAAADAASVELNYYF